MIGKTDSLILNKGQNISFGKDGGILVYGDIQIKGTEAMPVLFSSMNKDAGYLGLMIYSSPRKNNISWLNFTGARGGAMNYHEASGGFSVIESDVDIRHSRFHDLASNDGIHLSSATFKLDNLVVERTAYDALDIDWGRGSVTRSTFSSCGYIDGDCVDLSGTNVNLENIVINSASDKGVSVGESSVANIAELVVSKAHIGVAIKDGSQVQLHQSKLKNNGYGILTYIKKPYFTYPDLIQKHNIIESNTTNIRHEPKNEWTRKYD